MSQEAKIPESVPPWQSIDIYLFSNGQQNSPPRKYHLRTDDISWWNTTLKYLGKAQYGSEHSVIDLYTLEGRKVGGPLELSNGASYVAVEPPSTFVDAGYEKYLIKASRSWEKRRRYDTESNKMHPDKPKIVTSDMVDPNLVKTEEPKIRTGEDSLLLNTIISSVVNQNSSILVKPEHVSTSNQKNEVPSDLTEKSPNKKKPSIQRPTFIRKISPSVPPSQPLVSNIKTSLKKRDNIKTGTLSTLKPEGNKNSWSSNNKPTRLPIKSKLYKPVNKQKEPPIPETVASKVNEAVNVIKTSSSVEINIKNDQGMLTENINITNAVEDKEVVLMTNTYPQKESSLILVDSYAQQTKDDAYSKSQYLNENSQTRAKDVNHEHEGDVKLNVKIKNSAHIYENTIPPHISPGHDSTETSRNDPIENKAFNMTENMKLTNFDTRKVSILTKTISDNPPVNSKPEEILTYVRSETKFNTANSKENLETIVTKPSKDFKLTDLLSVPQYGINHKHKGYPRNVETENLITNKVPLKSHEVALLVYTSMTDQISNEQQANRNVNSNLDIMNNQIQINAHKSNEVIRPRASTTQIDQYVAVLNKGESVNLKLNIEIQNNGTSTKHIDNSNEFAKEKESQINIVSNTIGQNKSLVSLIVKEIQKHHAEDNHNVIIVQCNGCKYCDDNTVLKTSISKNENMPLTKCVENTERGGHCHNRGHGLNVENPSNPLKATFSSMSLERLTTVSLVKSQAIIAPLQIHTSIPIASESAIEKKISEKEILIKKKVSISNSGEFSLPPCNFKMTTERNTINNKYSKRAQSGIFIDKLTQTEWCNILLEVKLEDDGHYTFRLPSLQTLKYHKLV